MQQHRTPSPHSETLGIGERLRNAREARGLTLAATETLTHIRALYLQALEDEQFDRLPATVYARGYLRTYAAAVSLDPDELMEAYPAAFSAPAQPLVPAFPAEVPIRPAVPPSRLRRLVMYVGGIVVLVLAILALIGYQQLRQFAQPVPPPAPRPITVAEPAHPPPPPAQPGEAPAPVPGTGVELVIQATGTSWVRVLADDEEIFQGLVHEGEVKAWRARERLTVRVGDMTAVSVLVNGQPVQSEARRRVWEETFTAP